MRSIIPILALFFVSHLSFAADPAICEVHKEKMTAKDVPIRYGLPGFTPYSEKMRKAEFKSFPHALDYVEGGCVIRKEKTESVSECSVCRKKKEEWILKNPAPKS